MLVMGDKMNHKLYACSESALDVFKGKESALIYLEEQGLDEQKAVFLFHHNYEKLVKSCLSYFEGENLCWEQQSIFLRNPLTSRNFSMMIHPYHIDVQSLDENPLVEYLLRYHRNWCSIDENNRVIWLGYCQNI